MLEPWFIIDFDSTFTRVEAMEELAAISLKNDPDKDAIIQQIKHLTDMAMDGQMPFNNSLKARIALLSAKKYHLNMLVNKLRKHITPSFARNKAFFKKYQGRILIVSGGFKEFIVPIVKSFHIEEQCVFANTFTFDGKNNIIGADETNFLAQNGGKVKLLKHLKLKGSVYVIGDGYTDYEIKENGLAQYFFAFTENIVRQKVIEKSDYTAPNLDEILFKLKLPMALSYPKSKINAFLIGKETFIASKQLSIEGYRVIKREKVNPKLLNDLKTASIIVSSLDEEIPISDYKKLLCLAVWGNNKNQFNEEIAQKQALPIFNSPYANTRSVVELGLGFLFQFARETNTELKGKKIGLIGYGNAGSLMSVLAQNLGLEVYFFDEKDRAPLGNAVVCKTLPDLIKKTDYLVVLKSNNDGVIINQKELKINPKLLGLINLSYDNSVQLEAVLKMMKLNPQFKFGMDCLSEKTYLFLQNKQQVLVTLNQRNHTQETQQNIANFISEKIIQYINTGNISKSINFPEVQLPALQDSHRFIHMHQNKPGLLAKINAVLAKHHINVTSQHLKTKQNIGYVITDVAKKYDTNVINELKQIEGTLKFRVIY